MKNFKKIILFTVSAILLITLVLSFSALAEEEPITASGRFGELSWKFSKESGNMTVWGEGTMTAPAVYDFWYTYASFVQNIVIEEGAVNIAGDIFSYCKMLESVAIPESVTEIDENAFYISEYLVIKCNFGSYADNYAKENSIQTEYLNTPVFTENGLQLKVGNLSKIKLIRVAYGDYNTIGQISRAEDERTFTNKDVLRGRTDYTIQFREEGLVSVAVCCNNGYIEIYKYNVTKKIPEMVQEGNTVTFTGIEDLLVLRCAKGIYSTSNEIKNASGVVNIRGKDINTAAPLKIDLETGIYSFCVQYKDESYNYYVVTVE